LAKISNPYDRYINEPGKGPSFHTNEFMSGYYAGFNACLGTGYQAPPQQPRLYQPPIQRNPPVIVWNWIQTCSFLDRILVPPCYQLVNPDNTLTFEGDRARVCIQNGIMLAGGAYLLNLPLPEVIDRLRDLSTQTGCGGLVDWDYIGQVSNLLFIISLFV
jgi:hypothetical protein